MAQKRQILLETDGVSINIIKAEVTSLLEFSAIINQLSDFVEQQSKLIREQNLKKDIKDTKVEEKKEEIVKN